MIPSVDVLSAYADEDEDAPEDSDAPDFDDADDSLFALPDEPDVAPEDAARASVR